MHRNICWVHAAVLLLVLQLVAPVAAGRQLSSLMHHGKGPRYVVAAPAVGSFYQTRTYFAAPGPVPTTVVQQAPVVASYVQTAPVVAAQQPLVVASQPTIVAPQPTMVAAQPTIVAAGGPHKANLGMDVNMAIGFKINKSVEGDLNSLKNRWGR